jgi:hypothetical protein
MIARAHVLLPFLITILDSENYSNFEYEASGYRIRFLQPQKSQRAQSISYQISIDQRSAYQADVLIIEFQKESFDRSKGGLMDPDQELILEVSNSFIRRLRAVARAAQAGELVELSRFTIEYLNDDGSKLPEEERLVRGWGGYGGPVRLIITDEAVWNAMKALPHDFEPFPWESLLVDAEAHLPHVGISVVLAYAALEVLIGRVLNRLARVTIKPESLWDWIDDRGNFIKEPSMAEKFGPLLKIIAGKAPIDEQTLWKPFTDLKKARNSFVHEGTPLIDKTPVTLERAKTLIDGARKITQFVLECLPQEEQPKDYFPKSSHEINIAVPVPDGHTLTFTPEKSSPVDQTLTEK